MYAITGITGKVGGCHRTRLAVRGPTSPSGRPAMRDKGRAWSDLGCEVAIAEMEDGRRADPVHLRTSRGCSSCLLRTFDPETRVPGGQGP